MPGMEPRAHSDRQRGFTMVEAVVTLIVMALLLGAFSVVTSAAFETRQYARERERLTRNAAFAMQRMVSAARETPALFLPLAENPATAHDEALREQRVPPEPGKEDRSAVLAVRLAHHIDRNNDGVPDADNDADGRIDEDPGGDVSNDSEAGIIGIDDDHDGDVDENLFGSLDNLDDEEGVTVDDDPSDGRDNDGDLSVDEDPPADLNNDGAPGIVGVDDDGDGQTDEGEASDDDEDGNQDEDWYDPVVFYLDGSKLIERQAFPYDFTGDSKISGRDYIETVIAENVSYFRVERLARPRNTVVDITLELSGANAQTVSLSTRIRIGERS